MDLPTYTNIWRIEKRLYKLYDLRLPMPLPLVQIGVFLGVFVPWILMLRFTGVPFESPWHVLYIVPPGVLTWLATRPVIEGKRLTELLISQSRYLAEPRTWCRLTPIREPREVVIVARVWRRAGAPAPIASPERAAIKSRRKRKRAAAQPASPQPAAMPVLLPRPSAASAPPPLPEYAAQQAAPPKPWRRAHRDISHEDDVQPTADLGPATPPADAPGSGKRAFASGVRRPGAPPEVWQAAAPPPTRPDIPQQSSHEPRTPPPPVRATPPYPRLPEHALPPDPQDVRVAGPNPHPTETNDRPTATTPQPQTTPPTPTPDPAEPGAPRPTRPVTSHDTQQPGAPTPEPAAPTEPARPWPTRPATPHDAQHPGAPAAENAEPTEPGGLRPARPAAPHDAQQPGVPGAERAEPTEAGGLRPAASRDARRPGVPGAERVESTEAGGLRPARPAASRDARQPGVPGAERAESSEVSGPWPVRPDGSRDARQPGAPAGERAGSAGPGGLRPVRDAGRSGASGEQVWAPGETRRDVRQERPASGEAKGQELTKRDGGRSEDGLPQRSNGEVGDRKVAGRRVTGARPAAAQASGGTRAPATRPDVPVVPGAFGSRPENGPPPRMEPPRPWSEGLSQPVRPGAPPVPEPQPPQEAPAPVEEQAPPREVRSQPASPVRPRPLPPPPAPPPSGPAITPPDPEHEVTGGGLRRLFHAVGGGHGDVDAEYELRVQQPFHGTRHVVVLGCTGGAGQTVTSLMLGHTFAQHNGEPIVAVDVNPGPGALARRTRSDTNETLTGLITRADQVGSLTAMRRYTSQAKSGLDVIAAGKNPLQALDDRDYALAIRTIDRFYSVTLLDAAAAVVARVLPYADQLVLVAPASADATRAVAMTFEWLDGHGYEELRSRAVTVINGVSRRSMDDVEQAEAVARGRCRALVRIPWDDHLSMDRAPRNELKSLRTSTRRAYLALAGVVAGGFTVMPERYQEFQHEQEASR